MSSRAARRTWRRLTTRVRRRCGSCGEGGVCWLLFVFVRWRSLGRCRRCTRRSPTTPCAAHTLHLAAAAAAAPPRAGTAEGCAERAIDGALPLEHGTFLYGRDGEWGALRRGQMWVAAAVRRWVADAPRAAGSAATRARDPHVGTTLTRPRPARRPQAGATAPSCGRGSSTSRRTCGAAAAQRRRPST